MYLVFQLSRTVEHQQKKLLNFYTIILYQFLDHYIKDTKVFLFKLKNLGKIPKNAFLVTADLVELYPSIPDDESLEVSRKQLNVSDNKSIPTEDLVKMAEFVLRNNYFKFNSSFKHQISGTAVGTKFAPPYACIFMDYIEKEFLKNNFSPGFGLDILMIVFSSGQLVKKSLTLVFTLI